MIVQEPAHAAVWQCLNHADYKDAVFLAERVYAEVGTEEALFLLATCYYRAGKARRAYAILKQYSCSLPQAKYLLAKCCVEIDKLAEAESALLGNGIAKNKALDEVSMKYNETAPFVFQLLGHIYYKTERHTLAKECYRRSLKLNSFLWSSFEALCGLDDSLDVGRIFQSPSSHQISQLCQSPMSIPAVTPGSNALPLGVMAGINVSGVAPLCTPAGGDMLNTDSTMGKVSLITPVMSYNDDYYTPDNPPPEVPTTAPKSTRHRPERKIDTSSPCFGKLMLDSLNTPSPQGLLNFSTSADYQTSLVMTKDEKRIEHKAPSKKPITRRQQQLSAHNRLSPSPNVFSQSTNINNSTSPRDTHESSIQGPLRRSSRLFHNASSSSVKENNNKAPSPKHLMKAPSKKFRSKLTRTEKTAEELNVINREKSDQWMGEDKVPTNLLSLSLPQTINLQVLNMQRNSADGLVRLLQQLAKGYLALHRYRCSDALEHFENLPFHQYNTGWVLTQVAKAYFEQAQYHKAERTFTEVRHIAPQQTEGMEYYSTTLWHLQKEMDLSTLAQDMGQIDKNCPETWCSLGNCFSLQKEHDTAIQFLQRAIQIDPDFSYAYTLLGHEHVLTEELDKAMSCFRNAVRVDPGHYNAWYGMGMIYYKQEKMGLAEVHYKKALSINPHSSVILCHIGMVQLALKKADLALETLNKALELDPKNALCKFHRASILFAHEKHQEALTELEELKLIVPKESLVYFLMGKVHKKLGNTHLALMNFSWANDLDPKGSNNKIKEAIDKRHVTDEDDMATGVDESEHEMSNDSSVLEDGEEAHLQRSHSEESL